MPKPAARVFAVIAVLIACACSTAFGAESTPVEKLLTVAPEGMAGFVAASGGDECKAAFDKSSMGRICGDAQVQSFYKAIKQEILTKIQQDIDDPNAAMAFGLFRDFASLALKRPVIIGIAGKTAEIEKPPVYCFAIIEAGSRKTEIDSAWAKLIALADEGDIIDVKIGSRTMRGVADSNDFPVYWGWIENYFVIAVNDAGGLATRNLPGGAGGTYLSKVPASGDAMVLYLDREKLFEIFQSLAAIDGAEEDFQPVLTAVRELGFDRTRTIAARMGFVGPDMVCDEFIEAPQPRSGLLAQFKNADVAWFDMVDSRAMSATIANCDFSGVYDTIMNAIRSVTDANQYRQVESKIAEFESQAKFGIRKGLLESLSGEIIYYTLPAGIMQQSPQGGVVFIAKLKDSTLFEKTMAGVEEFAVANSNNMLQVSSKETDGGTRHIWAVMPLAVAQIMPCWTIVDGYLVVSSSPVLCDLAVAQILSRDNSLRKTAEYAKAVGKLPENITSVRYTNSKLQFSQMITTLQQFWPMATMGAAQQGLKLPFILPNLSPIIDEMEPSCAYAWSDSSGFYSHYRGTGIEPSLGSIGGTALVLGITMPALAKTRQVSYQLVSGSNLSAIGKACMVHANDHDEKFPDTLEQLIETADLSPKCLVSKFKPKVSSEPSYIYIAGQDTTMDMRNILAYENPKFSRGEINVLFLDAHVEKMDMEEFELALQATYNRLGQEMSDVK